MPIGLQDAPTKRRVNPSTSAKQALRPMKNQYNHPRIAAPIALNSVILSALISAPVVADGGRPSRGEPATSRTAMASQVQSRPVAPALPPLEIAPDQGVTPAGLPSWLVMLSMRPDPNDPQRVRDAEQAVEAVLAATIGADRAHQRYAHGIVGFAAGMTPGEAAVVAADPRVAVVEPDRLQQLSRSGVGPDLDNPNLPVPWNLRRISSPEGLPPDFKPCGATGAGVTAVVIDSGIALGHTEFAGRIVADRSFAMTGPPNGEDIEGHGTHVAGTIAGTTVGVAPQAKIVALRVEETSGSILTSSWMAAINWTLVPGNVTRPAVINMSLSGSVAGLSWVQEQIIGAANIAGIPVVVAAGNDSHLASWNTPAVAIGAITVGATDLDDRPALFSNHGSLVDIWAPGVGIVSADWQRPDGGLKMESGTSMAAPCVAGTVALFLESEVTPEDLAERASTIPGRAAIWLARNAAIGVLSDASDPRLGSPGGNGTLGGASNRLLQACTTSNGIVCDEPLVWHDGAASMVFGDGITPLGPNSVCERVVWSPNGPVTLTINWVSILADQATGLAAEVSVIDIATGEVVWSSDRYAGGDSYSAQLAAVNRFCRSTSNAGLLVRWQGRPGHNVVGYGYTMTARIAGGCPGDLNGDGTVDGADLGLIVGAWGPCPDGAACPGDLTLDGVVSGDDLGALLGAWGGCPLFVPAPYAVGCTGELLHKSFVGDKVFDCGSRAIVPSPLLEPTVIAVASACCEISNFDIVPGNPVSVGPSDETGACIAPDGSCLEATYFECAQAGRFFLGRGLGCDAVDPVVSGEALPAPPGSITTGWEIDWSNWFGSQVSPVSQAFSARTQENRCRQDVPPGIFSLSKLSFPAVVQSQSASKPNYASLGQAGSYPIPQSSIPFHVIVEFRDGGEPIVVERVARAAPIASSVASIFGTYFLFTLEDLLAGSDREIASIEIGCFRQRMLAPSGSVVLGFAGRASGPGEAPARFSPDGGRTWLVGNLPVQMGLCITP